MATITKTYTENEYSSYKSTWTLTFKGTDQNIGGNTFTLTTPTLAAKYVYSSKKYGYVDSEIDLSVGGYYDYGNANWLGKLRWYRGDAQGAIATTSGTTYTIGVDQKTFQSKNTSAFFSSSNPTVKTLNVYAKAKWISLFSSKNYDATEQENGYEGANVSLGIIGTLSLNAPPTFENPTISYINPSGITDCRAGLTTVSASVPINSATAKYGGYVKKITLTVGNQTATKEYTQSTAPTTTQTVSLPVANADENIPVSVTVTDSRNQSTTKSLEPIMVLPYNVPSFTFGVFRSNSNGVRDDEGTYGLITANVNYDADTLTNSITSLTVSKGTTDISGDVTWYSSYDNITGVSNPISSFDDIEDNETIFGLVDGSFSLTEAYQISMAIADQYKPSQTLTQSLSTAYYTMDILAGGREIAFGAPAKQTDLYTPLGGTSAPTFELNKYYKFENASYSLLTEQPEDWSRNWQDYYTQNHDSLFKCNMDASFKDKNDVIRMLFDFVYPIGSYYETSDSTFDPNATWGGTWSLETEGLVHIGAGTGYNIGDTGGSKYIQAHTHGFTQPVYTVTGGAVTDGITGGSHHHATSRKANAASGTARYIPDADSTSNNVSTTDTTHKHNLPSHSHTVTRTTNGAVNAVNGLPSGQSTGSAGNMQPYIVVNRWHRTA